MTTKYEVIEGDHWRYVSSWDTLIEAAQEADRLNNLYNRGYFVQKNVDGVIYHRRKRRVDDMTVRYDSGGE